MSEKKSSLTQFSVNETEYGKMIDLFSMKDLRGRFDKVFEKDFYYQNGIDFNVNEIFITSSSKNVLRGIHFQTRNPQDKVITVVSGKVWDVVVDLRPNSKTCKKWWSMELNGDKPEAIFIPRGFGHGFLSLSGDVKMLYICNGKYDKESDSGIIFNDPDIGISWPVDDLSKTIHSDRDLNLQSFEEYIKRPIEL